MSPPLMSQKVNVDSPWPTSSVKPNSLFTSGFLKNLLIKQFHIVGLIRSNKEFATLYLTIHIRSCKNDTIE